jgi:hypothetical protein
VNHLGIVRVRVFAFGMCLVPVCLPLHLNRARLCVGAKLLDLTLV